MTTKTKEAAPPLITCPCCGDKTDEPDIITYQVYLPARDTPTSELLKDVCDICGETRQGYRTPIAARIIYRRHMTGELLRDDYWCEDCFTEFKERHHYYDNDVFQETLDAWCPPIPNNNKDVDRR